MLYTLFYLIYAKKSQDWSYRGILLIKPLGGTDDLDPAVLFEFRELLLFKEEKD